MIAQQTLGMAWIFGWVLLIVLIRHLRWKKRQFQMQLLHKERLVAMEKGLPVPDMHEYDSPNSHSLSAMLWLANEKWTLFLGLAFLFGGAGTILALWLQTDPFEHSRWPYGLIPIFLGIGFLVHHRLTRKP